MAQIRTLTSRNAWVAVVAGLSLMMTGCGKSEPSPAEKSATTGTADAPASQAVYVHTPPGADKDDDPKYPRALPRSNDVRGWVKTRAVRLAPAEKAADLTDDAGILAALRAFRIVSIAGCRYNQQYTSADVLYVQTATPADAFGLLTILSSQPCQWHAGDRSIRSVQTGNAEMRMLAQQGNACICMTANGRVDLEGIQQDCRRLMDSIVFNLPATDPPLLLQLIPEPQRASTRVWLTRDMNALSKAENPLIRRVAPGPANDLLGLAADTTLSIAAVPATETIPAQLIWLAEYPTAAAAKATYDRCTAATDEVTARVGLKTTVLPARGNRLAGVWNEPAAAQSPMLKALHDALPK
jgi:hypothetical protein